MWEGHEGRGLSYAKILGRSAYLGTRFARLTKPGDIVGVMMPTSIPGALAFWGLQFAHRIPAWLNFTMGPAAFLSTVRTAQVRSVITSRAFIATAKLEDRVKELQADGVSLIYLEDLKPSWPWKLRAAWIQFTLTGAYRRHEAAWIRAGRDPRCAVLFTSGSSGLPKAVVLSHRNLLANVAQLRVQIDFTHRDCVFNALSSSMLSDLPAAC